MFSRRFESSDYDDPNYEIADISEGSEKEDQREETKYSTLETDSSDDNDFVASE